MISISRMLCDTIGLGDDLRYNSEEAGKAKGGYSLTDAPRPIVVWNFTQQCNLRCVHCYANADNTKNAGEMTTKEGKAFIRDLAEYGIPVLLFSGGEPLMRKDIFELAGYAREQGLRLVISTNGTLITEEIAKKLQDTGFEQVGISLDGIGEINDRFRGKKGAYEEALRGIRNCINLGQRVSIRITMTRSNFHDVPDIFRIGEEEKVPRLCFYHLAYAGRGDNIRKETISHSDTRAVLDLICEHSLDLHKRGLKKEILTVDNHADGVYLYLKYKEKDPSRARHILSLLERSGGNSSGSMIAAVDDLGNVHPDQFWRSHSFGNVRERKFGDIWTDTSEPLMHGLRNRREYITGRCGKCQYFNLCNGNLRLRAEAVYGDIWAADPACYLTDEEIGITG